VKIWAWPAICNHLVYLIWRVKYCGWRGGRPTLRQEMNVCLCY